VSALPWFKCYPRDFREGMTGLTCEERGAYVTLLLLMYERGAPIADDDSWVAAQLWCSVRAWKKLRAALIVKGKIYALNYNGADCLMNRRAADELAKTAQICTSRSEAGKEGGKRSAAKRTPKVNENNDEGEANASPVLKQTASNDQADIQTIRKSSEANASGAEPPSANAKAWAFATTLLVAQGGLTVDGARAFFGKLLSQNGLEASDLLAAIGEAEHNATRDPQGYLTKAAQARGTRRQTGPPKRVGWV
jgi:uncharacterized protein YdaU (DUF1376 family)